MKQGRIWPQLAFWPEAKNGWFKVGGWNAMVLTFQAGRAVTWGGVRGSTGAASGPVVSCKLCPCGLEGSAGTKDALF